jgi:predicted GNAT family N-acyltransferase
MNHSTYHIRQALWPEEQSLLRQVRESVFVMEQGVSPDLEWDHEDARAYHLLALDPQQNPIATARLLSNGQIGRMAVLPKWRKQGVGTTMMQALIEEASRIGLTLLFLHAQTHAQAFYERLDFTAVGEPFYEADIPHRYMTRSLFEPIQNYELSLAVLGKSDDHYPLSQAEDFQIHATSLVRQAKRTLLLLSLDLDPLTFDTHTFLEATKNLALRSRFSRIQILLQDNTLVVQKGHRLIDLAQRLTSSIEIRKPAEEHLDIVENFMIVDNCGYLHKPQATLPQGNVCYNDRVRVHRFQGRFDEIWKYATPDRELSRLHL